MSTTPVKVDIRDNLPSPYITFNPAMLDDEKWTYRDLQKLAVKLNVGGKGTREQLIDRLRDWHKRQFNNEKRCAGSNFSLLEVELPPSPKEGEVRKGGISPALLSPLKSRSKKNNDGTPVSILSAKKKGITPTSHNKKITFSIFNGTKIIPPREAIHRRWMLEDGIDPDYSSDSETEELDDTARDLLSTEFEHIETQSLAQADINASRNIDITSIDQENLELDWLVNDSLADMPLPTTPAKSALNTPLPMSHIPDRSNEPIIPSSTVKSLSFTSTTTSLLAATANAISNVFSPKKNHSITTEDEIDAELFKGFTALSM